MRKMLKKALKFCLIFSLIFAAMHFEKIPTVYADSTLLEDNFNNRTTGSQPTGWTYTTDAGTSCAIANIPSSSDKSVAMSDNTSSGAVQLYKTFTSQAEYIRAEWSFMETTAGRYSYMIIKSGSSYAIELSTSSSGLVYYDQNNNQIKVETLSSNTWYTVLINANIITNTYDIYVNGVSKVKGAVFTSTAASLDSIYFKTSGSYANNLYIDNVKIVSVSQDDYAKITTKYFKYLTGGMGINTQDEYISAKTSLNDVNAGKYYNTMNSSCVWDDCVTVSLTDPAYISQMYNRIYVMALAWSTPGSIYFHNADMLVKMKNGLDWLYTNRYYRGKVYYGNWWAWCIGTPYNLLNTTTLLSMNLSPTQISNYMDAIDYYSPGPANEGANLADFCAITILKGIFQRNPAEVLQGSTGLSPLFDYVTEKNGFYTDGSYIMHYYDPARYTNYYGLPYNGSYGPVHFSATIRCLWLLDNTQWNYTGTNRSNIFDMVFNSFEPFLQSGLFVLPVDGRAMSRSSLNLPFRLASDFFSGLYLSTELTYNPRINDTKGILKKQANDGGRENLYKALPTWAYLRVKAIAENASIAEYDSPDGNRIYRNMDVVSQKAANWYFINRMHSTRVANFEFTNGEGKRMWYTADGATFVYSNPNDYLRNWIWALDYHRIPGTTVDRWTARPNESVPNDTKTVSSKSFVGGVSLEGKYGISSMDFQQHNVAVTPAMNVSAKKSWFMFDDEIVALGSGINSTSGRSIETIVDNRVIKSDGSNILTVNGTNKPTSLGWSESMEGTNWIYLEDTGGYYFPDGATIKGLREKRTQDPIEVGASTSSDSFNASQLNVTNWNWIREDNTGYSYTGNGTSGALVISSQNGTLQGSANTTKNLMLENMPDDGNQDFVNMVKLTFSPAQQRQEAGLIVYLDDNNYITVSRAYTSEGIKFVIGSETGGTYTETTTSDAQSSTVYLKIEREGETYTGYYSAGGDSWNFIGSIDHSFTVSSDKSLKIGLFAQNGDYAADSIDAIFDDYSVLMSGKFVTMWFDHGIDPGNETYQYVLLPTMTAWQTQNYASNPDISVLCNTDNIHAVRENTLNVTGITFWNPLGGTIDKYAAYNAGSMIVKETEDDYTICISDPSQQQTTMSFEINEPGTGIISSDNEITVTDFYPHLKFTVDTRGSKGKTFVLKIRRAGFLAAADSYIRDGNFSNTNYGTETIIPIKYGSTDFTRKGILKFDLSSAGLNSVASAKLHICQLSEAANAQTITAYRIADDTWTETDVNWDNAPVFGSNAGSVGISVGSVKYYTIDITSYVNDELAGDKIISLGLSSSLYNGWASFSSREGLKVPLLEIVE